MQVRFKRKPTGQIFFGLEMQPGPPIKSATAKSIKKGLLRLMQKRVGDGFYETAGDGEAEPPCFVMPMWALDQFDIAEPGQEPDIRGDLHHWGLRRRDGPDAYKEAVNTMVDNFDTNKVYTFCFWSVSKFLDIIHWRFKGTIPGFRMSANKLCGRPPIYVVAYQLHTDEAAWRQRHDPALKNYFFKVATWTELHPPEQSDLQRVLGEQVVNEQNGNSAGCPDAAVTPKASVRKLQFPRLTRAIRCLPCTPTLSDGRQAQDHTTSDRATGSMTGSPQAMPQSQGERRRRQPAPWVSAGQRLFGSCMGGGA